MTNLLVNLSAVFSFQSVFNFVEELSERRSLRTFLRAGEPKIASMSGRSRIAYQILYIEIFLLAPIFTLSPLPCKILTPAAFTPLTCIFKRDKSPFVLLIRFSCAFAGAAAYEVGARVLLLVLFFFRIVINPRSNFI